MDTWIVEFWRTLDWFTGYPAPSAVTITLRIFWAMALLFAFEFIAYAFGSPQVGWARVFGAAVISTVILVGTVAANEAFILPELEPGLVLPATIAVPILVFIILITPMNCLFRKLKYFCMLSSFALGILASFLFFSAANAVLGTVRAGEKSYTIRERRQWTDDMLND